MLKRIKKIIRRIFGGRSCYYWRYFWDKKAMKKALSDNDKIQRQTAEKVAILFIGTNRYIYFFPNYYNSLKKLFLPNTPKDFFVFTDQNFDFIRNKKNVIIIPIKHENFPFINLRKFKFINKAKRKLKKYSHIVYIDADMYASSFMFENEFFNHNKPLFAVLHHDFVKKKAFQQFESNPKSMANVGAGDFSTYWQACFWGGKSADFLKAVEKMAKDTEEDIKKGIIAKWWDESFLNKYLIEHKKDVHTLNPAYSYPELKPIPKGFEKKIIHTYRNPTNLEGLSIKKGVRKERID